jgi:hypothetical protein
MKVELLVNLKYGTFKTHGKGEVFEAPFPPEIQQEVNMNRGTVRIIEDPAPIQKSEVVIETPIIETPKAPIKVKSIKKKIKL